MKTKKIVSGIVIALSIVLLTTGCGKAKLKNGEEVAIKINGKNITADDLYSTLKKKYVKNIIMNTIDKKIFDEVYKNDKEIEEGVKNEYEAYESQYSQSGTDFEEILKSYGYQSAEEFKEEIRLDLQRTKAVDDYLKESITDEEIKKYYEEKYSGEVSVKHILISVKDGLTEEEALAKANDLIKQLDEGADFDELAKANSDDPGTRDKGGDLGYFGIGQMVKEFEEAAFALKVNKYTKTPVKTTYGYHIILKTGEKEKKALKEVKDDIIDTLVSKKREEDSTISITALDKIRKNYGLKFSDSSVKKAYEDFLADQIKQYEEAQ